MVWLLAQSYSQGTTQSQSPRAPSAYTSLAENYACVKWLYVPPSVILTYGIRLGTGIGLVWASVEDMLVHQVCLEFVSSTNCQSQLSADYKTITGYAIWAWCLMFYVSVLGVIAILFFCSFVMSEKNTFQSDTKLSSCIGFQQYSWGPSCTVLVGDTVTQKTVSMFDKFNLLAK